MRTKWVLALAAASVLAACAAPSFVTGLLSPLSALRAPDGRPIVTTRQGQIQGVTQDGIASFQGVRYATAPIGALRWRPPAPAPAHREVVLADKPGALCMQIYNGDDAGVGPPPTSEDCLTLNIWTRADVEAPQPVMVWLHAGGFATGSGTGRLHDGASLARRGVVMVTLNYRIGRLGFFAHPALTREAGPSDPIANYGLMDQIAALQWVRDNIAAFGGDPNNVTLFGQDAGAMSVLRLMTIQDANGLFHKAIVQSGAGLERSVRLGAANADGLEAAEAMGAAFAARAGAGDDAAALRAIPAERIVDAGALATYEGGGPIIDGRLLKHDVAEAFRAGEAANIPMIIGANSLEIPLLDGDFDRLLQTYLKPSPLQRAAMRAPYPDENTFRQRVMSDVIFAAPARQIALWGATAGAPVYLYRFGVVSQFARWRLTGGAPHGSDRQYVLGNLRASAWPTAENDNLRSAEIMAYWVQFARSGDPNGDDQPNWPRYLADNDALMEFANDGPVARRTPDGALLDRLAALRMEGR